MIGSKKDLNKQRYENKKRKERELKRKEEIRERQHRAGYKNY